MGRTRRKFSSEEKLKKVSLKTRTLIETEVQKIHEKTEIKISVLAVFAGISKSTWHEWKTRKGIQPSLTCLDIRFYMSIYYSEYVNSATLLHALSETLFAELVALSQK